ncbi:alpha/beta fold hydrolase [Aestuariibius insulae]|uniref:alpha/beta fold hydrolase n=1 Tax=Aestuariibius insulae TaxID=2058287 RepID=UPI00345E404E
MLKLNIYGAESAPPVLFLHPGNATGRNWEGLAKALPGYRVICPDLPGFGDSAHIPLTTIEAAADEVARALDAAGITDPLPVMGYSLGAYTGMMLLLRHPDRVERALLTSFQIEPLKGAWWMIPLGDLIAPLMTFAWPRRQAFKSLGIPETSSWWPSDDAPSDAATLRAISRIAVRFDIRDRLTEIGTPCLIMAGEKEQKTIKKAVAQIPRQVPGAIGLIAPGGHGWPASHEALFTHTVRAWLDQTPLPADLHPPEQARSQAA